MLVRRAFLKWLIPAAFVLPVWLVVGWGVFTGAALGYLWVVLLAAPVVFVAELVLTLLVRTRHSVRTQRAASWWDVAGFGLWHAATIAAGFYQPPLFGFAVLVAIIAVIGVFWSTLWQLWNEARPSAVLRRTLDGYMYVAPPMPGAAESEPVERPVPNGGDVIVIEEKRAPGA